MSNDLLAALFDRCTEAIMIVSGYDETVTYANMPALAGTDLVHPGVEGEPFKDVMAKIGIEAEQAPIARCLQAPHVLHANRNPGDRVWWVASVVPCADPGAVEVFGSGHTTDSRQDALAEHDVLIRRAAMAIEWARCRRLQDAALAAIVDANRRLDWVGGLMITAGQLPINPEDGHTVAMH